MKNNQGGFIAMDFLFAMMLVGGFCAILFATSISFVVIETVQYISFATARAYYGAHLDERAQRALAEKKFDHLIKVPALRPLFNGSWFKIEAARIGDFNSEFEQNDPEYQMFIGARIPLRLSILEMNIPFFGKTFTEEDGFRTQVSSFLARAPTTEECMQFNSERYPRLRNVNPNFQPAFGNNENSYVVMGDNGC